MHHPRYDEGPRFNSWPVQIFYTVDILVAPQEHPYDNDILFDVGTAQLAGCAITVEQLDDLHTGVVTCHGCSYHQGLHANHSQSRC